MARSTRITDLILPVAVVAVVGMMIFPLPNVLLDTLLVCNIAFALSLLISCVYLSDPARFTSLPTILLLATIFRLGLNISTTRQLLAYGEAPEIVKAFGNFVASGNLVVGSVVFVIVTLVQFLVIAKGAERVAEVAARFTLDAMPGKQMSIDADVRAGMISAQEAKERRLGLQRESKLYGSLDGAMKFVKGDAIAGILITLINIGAGLVIGVTMLGMPIEKALATYTLFTIGDGLVSQIPALLVAVAAGIAVTRVEDKTDSFLGRDLFSQLGKEPQALATTSGFLLILGLVPGLPTIAFLTGAAVLFLISRKARWGQNNSEKLQKQAEFRPRVFSAIFFRVSADGTHSLQREGTLPQRLQELRTRVFDAWGVIVPEAQFDIDYELKGATAVVFFNGVKLDSLSIVADNTSFTEKVVKMFEKLLYQHLAELIDDTETRMLLEVHQSVAEDLINAVVPQMMSVTALTTLLRQLVLEGVSIKELRLILQAVAEYGLSNEEGTLKASLPTVSHGGILTELKQLQESARPDPTRLRELLVEVREKLARTISRTVCDEQWRLRAWVVDPSLDHLLSRIAFAGAPLEPGFIQGILRSVKRVATSERVVLITTKYARTLLAEIVRTDLKNVSVLALNEIAPEVRLTVVGTIQTGVAESIENEIDEELLEESAALEMVAAA